jgi:hypothetical protein
VEKLILKIEGTIKVLTVHNVMGAHQSFNNQCYSWEVTPLLLTVFRNDKKWHAYFPMANIVEAEIEELKK